MEDKIAVIEDALTQMQYKDYVTPSVHTGLGTCFDIGTAELFLLRAYYNGEITYNAPARLKRKFGDDLTTTDLFNIFHDEYKELIEPHWEKEFIRISGITQEQADACYWQNVEIPNDEVANKKLIEYLEEIDRQNGAV